MGWIWLNYCFAGDESSLKYSNNIVTSNPMLHLYGVDKKNSLTRFIVTRDGLASGLLAMIHCNRMRIVDLSTTFTLITSTKN